MEFNIVESPSIVNGYPTYRIDIDGDIIAHELENLHLTPEQVDRVVKACEHEISFAIAKEIKKTAYKMYIPMTKTGVLVRAEVAHQVWCGDELIECDGDDYTGDCAMVLDNVSLEDLPKPENVGQACSDGDMDYIFEEGKCYGLFDEWDGPYEVYVYDGDYERYYEARKELED